MFIRKTLRLIFSSFLAIPTAVIAAFMLLALGSSMLEQADLATLRPFRSFMQDHVFGNTQATSNLLGTIAGGIITVTSITFSLLLLAMQQSAASMTAQVFDQFLQRRLNQLYFGFFVGIALYALPVLATVDPPFNPVLGASLALLLTIVALYLLLLLIYSTISQMRPAEVIRAIHDHTLAARRRQLPLVQKTCRESRFPTIIGTPIVTPHEGFFVGLDLDAIARAIDRAPETVEVVIQLPIGSYVAFRDTIAHARTAGSGETEQIAQAVEGAIEIRRGRQLQDDPAYGIEQLETIAWRSISTSQQNPAPGLAVIQNLRDFLSRWAEESEDEDESEKRMRILVVYPDNVMARLLNAFESLAVVASEAMQHQTYAEIVRTFTLTFDRLPSEIQRRVENILCRSLSALGDHVLTTELDTSLTMVVQALHDAGRIDTAAAIHAAQMELATTVGKLNSRATRVPSAF